MRSRPRAGPDGDRGTPCADPAQVTAGKDLYVSETTDLVATGARDAAAPSEAPAVSGTSGTTRRRGSGLSGMLLPELQRLAADLGVKLPTPMSDNLLDYLPPDGKSAKAARELAERFEEMAVPDHGRYVAEPARAEDGSAYRAP